MSLTQFVQNAELLKKCHVMRDKCGVILENSSHVAKRETAK